MEFLGAYYSGASARDLKVGSGIGDDHSRCVSVLNSHFSPAVEKKRAFRTNLKFVVIRKHKGPRGYADRATLVHTTRQPFTQILRRTRNSYRYKYRFRERVHNFQRQELRGERIQGTNSSRVPNVK